MTNPDSIYENHIETIPGGHKTEDSSLMQFRKVPEKKAGSEMTLPDLSKK
jgi:hypothetical protein